jgi:hypothetical protein
VFGVIEERGGDHRFREIMNIQSGVEACIPIAPFTLRFDRSWKTVKN